MPHDPETIRTAVADFEQAPSDTTAWAVVPAARRAWVEVFAGAPDGPVCNPVTDALAAALEDARDRLAGSPHRTGVVREVVERVAWYRLLLRALRAEGSGRVVRLLEYSREQFDLGVPLADVTAELQALVKPDPDVMPVPAVVRGV